MIDARPFSGGARPKTSGRSGRSDGSAKLWAWRRTGFSTHLGEPIPPQDARAIEDMASYVVRNPVSLKRLVYIDGQQAVIYRALKPNPRLGANFVALDPLEWLARMADHIPDPGKHRTLAYGHYANRARGARAKEKELLEGGKAEAPRKARCSPSWITRDETSKVWPRSCPRRSPAERSADASQPGAVVCRGSLGRAASGSPAAGRWES